MTLFQPGQRVQTNMGPATVQGPSSWGARFIALVLDDSGPVPYVVNRRPDQLTPLEEQPMTLTTAQPVKQSRKDRKPTEDSPIEREDVTVAPDRSSADIGNPISNGPALAPGTLGLHAVPLSLLVRSSCNVRRHYDPLAIEELGASLKAEGQIENATGRWNAEGQIEIVAGESRRRAQVLREETGEADLTLLVNIRELTDAEALSISATENMRRRSMTALEECEAMLRLQEAGRTTEELAAMFGYKTQQPVVDRVLVARNLLTQGRDLLDAGQLSLACAFVIARAPGESLQKSLIGNAQRGHPASSLARFLTDGQFLVKHAKFNVQKSGLEINRDLFDTFEPYFAHKGKALDAQLEWANAQAEKARAKGKHPFVAVESGESAWSVLGGRKYVHNYSDTGNGLIYFVSTVSGEVTTETRYRLKASEVPGARASGAASADAVTREMPASAHDAAHVYRARALRHRLLGDSHRTLVLTVHALIVSTSGSTGRAAIRPSDAWQGHEITDEAIARIQTWQATLSAALGVTPTLVNQGGEMLHGADVSLHLYDYLFTLDTPELLSLLNVVVASRVYEPHYTDSRVPAAPLYARLAGEVDADAYLAETFTLTDEWLKRYPRHELVALAEEAGLGRALVEDAKTLKEMRGRILEHAEKLRAEGFVPKMVRFPEPPVPPDHSERDALRAKAAPIIAGLDRAGIDSVLVSLGLDWTDWDSLDDCRTYLHTEMLGMGVEELREWTALWEAAQ